MKGGLAATSNPFVSAPSCENQAVTVTLLITSLQIFSLCPDVQVFCHQPLKNDLQFDLAQLMRGSYIVHLLFEFGSIDFTLGKSLF